MRRNSLGRGRWPAVLAPLAIAFQLLAMTTACGGDKASSANTTASTGSAATATTAAGTTVTTIAADAAAGDVAPEQLIRQYIDPVIEDEYNLDVTDAMRAAPKPARGGVLKIRTPNDFEDMNPLTSTSQPDRVIQLLLYDYLVDQDEETREMVPVLAWSFAKGDLLKKKGGEIEEGTFTEKGNEEDPNSEVTFVPGALRYTFFEGDVANADIEGGKVTLKEQWGSKVYQGKVRKLFTTYEVNQAFAPEFAGKEVKVKMSDLDTWTDQRGAETLHRPYRLQECAFYFYIRPGVTWHDGKPFSGNDVKFTVECILNVNILAQALRSYFENITTTEVLDNGMTVHFRSKKPYFNQFLFLSQMYTIPKHVFNPEQFGGDDKAFAEAFNKHPFREKPTGTGPYKFTEWRKGDRMVMDRYDGYWASKLPAGSVHNWKPEQPYMDRIENVLIQEKSVALKELQKGTIDADMDVEPDTWFQADANTPEFLKQVTRAKRYGFLYTYIALNNERPLFKDKETRKALAMLIPREKVQKDIFQGLADPVTGPNYSKGPGYDRSVPQVPYDPAAAKRALRKAGWLDRDNDGIIEKEIDGVMVPFKFEYLIHGAREYHQKVADIYKEAVETAGISMLVKKLDFNVLMDQTRDKEFDVSRQAWGTELDPDPYQIWHSTQAENKGSNIVSFRNEKADRLMEKLREEFDPPKRWEMAREVHRIIAEEQPVIFLEGFWETYFIARGVQGVKLYPSMYPYRVREWWWADPARRTKK